MGSFVISAFADEAATELNEQIRICKSNGINHIEMRGVNGKSLVDHTSSEVTEIKKVLDSNGFKISSIGSPFGKIGITDDFSKHLEQFKHTLEIAHILQTKYIRIFSFYIPKEQDTDLYKNEVLERIGKFVELSRGSGVICCHENESGIYGDNAVRCKIIYDEFKGELPLIFDPANFINCNQDTKKAYLLLKNCIEYFHIKDSLKGKIVPAGEGEGCITEILNDFANLCNRQTILSVEPHLKVFDGYNSLETENKSIKEDHIYDSNETAFSTAIVALKAILCSLGFELSKNQVEGVNQWKKFA